MGKVLNGETGAECQNPGARGGGGPPAVQIRIRPPTPTKIPLKTLVTNNPCN